MGEALARLGPEQACGNPAVLLDAMREIHETLHVLPREETYGLTAQLRSAGVSIASNIAEGSRRGARSDYRSFLRMARGSALEVQTQLLIAHDLGFGVPGKIEEAQNMAEEISKMLWAIIDKV
jgi:four helix bundle protein